MGPTQDQSHETLKAKVTALMDLARSFRHADSIGYDKAYLDLQRAAYELGGAVISHPPEVEPRICYDHGPWRESTQHRDDSYCERCLVRFSFKSTRRCDHHIKYVPRDDV